MNILKDWIYALKVCKKYNITWNPFHNLNSAECSYNFDKRSKTVMMSPFYPKFIDSFMHEVGHLLRWDKIWERCITSSTRPLDSFNLRTDCILKEEYEAWKFSKRSLKSRFDKDRARLFFSSYYKCRAKEIGSLRALDVYYSFDRKI